MIAANPSSGDRRIVAIYGPSGCGKSQVAKALAAALGEERATRVAVDSFIVPRPARMLMTEYRSRLLAWDWALLAQRLALPLGTVTSTPAFDFDAFVRRGPLGGMPFTVRPVMILDAIEPYPAADLRVLLAVPDDVRRARIIDRDRRWGARVIDTWDHLQASWEHIRERAPEPHLVVDGTRPLAETVARIAAEIDAAVP